MTPRPLSVTIIGWLYVVTGAVGFAYHLTEWNAQQPFAHEFVWVELVRLLAILSGVFVLRGHNWARWFALAWIAWHVILSAFHTPFQLAFHSLFCAIVAYLLFHQKANGYFGVASMEAKQNVR